MGTLISKENGDLKKPFTRLALDVFFFIVLVIPVAIFNLTDVVQPNVRGFYCSDNSIRYPYRSNTVQSLALFLVGMPVVVVVTGMIECAYYYLYRVPKRGVFHPVIVALYRVYGYFIVGATINQILTDTAKLTIGRLRPMFLDVCLPSVQCNSSIEHIYVLDYTCTRTEYPGYTAAQFKEMTVDSRKSFPSGHSSFALYCAVFGVIYLELRLKYKMVRMFKICCQTFVMAGAVWVCCTRYLDNKHHVGDILAGATLGTIIGIYAVYLYYRSLTYCQRKRQKRSSISSQLCNGESHLFKPSPQVEPRSSIKIDVDRVSSM